MQDAPPSQRLGAAKRKAAFSKLSLARRRRVFGVARKPAVPKFPFHFADQPLRKFVKMKYVVHLSVASPGVGAITAYEFRANGMYDPEVAVGGHQPYGFDQLMGQYNHFTVLKAMFDCENQNVQYADTMMLIPALTADSGTLAAAYAAGGVNGLTELPIAGQTLALNTYGSDTRGHQRRTRLYFDAAKYFGKRAWDLIGDDRFSGSESADPPEQAFFGFALYNPLNTQPNHSYPITVTITYYACLTEPKWFTTS